MTQSVHRTAAGRITHRWTWGADEFATFNRLRLNPKNDREYYMVSRVIGTEPFPGEMRDPFLLRNKKPVTLDLSNVKSTLKPTRFEYRCWPPKLEQLVPARKFFDSLRTHIGLCHWRSIAKVDEDGWSPERIAMFNASTRHERISTLTSKHKFAISTSLQVYRTLLMSGELYGSVLSGKSHRSSFVMVRLYDHTSRMRRDILKYARVQFYFKHTFNGQVHHFASVKYYIVRNAVDHMVAHNTTRVEASPWVTTFAARTEASQKVKADETASELRKRMATARNNFVTRECKRISDAEVSMEEQNPSLQPEFELPGDRDILPVQRIAGRFIPCPRSSTKGGVRTKTLQALRCPPKGHA
jgi:hypothetical protein